MWFKPAKKKLKERTVTVPLICNPSTGESLTLPSLNTKRKGVSCYLGYDPIDKQFKVLCITNQYVGSNFFDERFILTIETGKELSWRSSGCDISHDRFEDRRRGHSIYDGICIDGVLFYLGFFWGSRGS